LHEPVHDPARHWSAVVQALPSLQVVPSFAMACVQPSVGEQASTVQGLPSSQLTSAPAHWPLLHTSLFVQAFPSLQVGRMQALPPSQSASDLHAAAFVAHLPVSGVMVQPMAGSHDDDVHCVPAGHVIGTPAQVPFVQASPCVQALPSLQEAVLFTNLQPVAVSQESFVQGFWSLHTMGAPLQVPWLQTSSFVHALPSLQGAAFGVNTHPVAGLQLSFVQGLLSLHESVVPRH
jgi:hypothetical protein